MCCRVNTLHSRSRLAKIETAVAVQTMAAHGGWNSGCSYRFFRLAPNRTKPEMRQYLSRRSRRLFRGLIRGSISQSSSALPNEILNFSEQQSNKGIHPRNITCQLATHPQGFYSTLFALASLSNRRIYWLYSASSFQGVDRTAFR